METRASEAVQRCRELKTAILQDRMRDLLQQKSPEILSMIERSNDETFRELDFRLRSWSSSSDLQELTKVRSPWYKLEKRTPAPLLFGVFSRERFKVIRNLSTAVNLTCYHGFYPNLFGQTIMDALFLYFQSRAARRLLELNMRRYGDSLDKFEPNDLNRALAPSVDWFAKLPPNAVSKALESCRIGNGLPDFMDDLFDELISETEQSHGTLPLARCGQAVVHA